MSSKHEKTLKKITQDPVRSGIPWRDIERLLVHLGAHITEGEGSRVRIELNEERAVFHRPHPEKVIDKGAVKSMWQFLINAGVIDEL